MKNLIERDKKRRNSVQKKEKQRQFLKQTVYNCRDFKLEDRWAAAIKLSRLPRNSSKTRLRNRCIFSGRSRGVFKQFRMSRHFLRNNGKQGFLPGLVKASW
jgi:small subunit ribosomal protein S14